MSLTSALTKKGACRVRRAAFIRLCFCLFCLAGFPLAGCSALPAAGPSAKEVVEEEIENSKRRFDVVPIDPQVLQAILSQHKAGFSEAFREYAKPPPPRIGVGDLLSVTIWQASPPGAMAAAANPASLETISLPAQVVGPDGGISVPYAGRIPVAGRLPPRVQQEIESRLAGKVIEPQAIVTILKSASDVATISGEVVNGARVPLPLNGERLLDLIAAAGGARAPIYDTFVLLTRRGVTVTLPMERLVSEPAENIYVWPGDVVTLVRTPQSFTVLGATRKNEDVTFGAERLSLIEAVGKAEGLADERADPDGVFLFRFEPPSVVKALHAADLGTGPGGSSPVVYRLALRDAGAYFLAQEFPVENKDVLYVANAPSSGLQKFFALLGTITAPIFTGFVAKQSVQ
jgi:polysaccharide export outer membrane protein